MSSTHTWLSILQTCLVLVLVLCILIPDDVTANPIELTNQKRGSSGRRNRRIRYRVGYMFGKRSGTMGSSSSLFDAISRRLVSVQELSELLREDPEILQNILRHLDKNDDGYITVSDLM